MERDNETWLVHLNGSGPDQQAALADLRDTLLRAEAGVVASGACR